MSGSSMLLFFVFLFIGVQFTLFGYVSYWAGKNKRFDLYAFGIKTHSTRSNPEIWAVISKDWGLAFMLEGVAILIVTIAFRDYVVQNAVVFSSTFVSVVLATAVIFVIKASKMARQLTETEVGAQSE
jgi:hypothetical protein